MFKKVLMVLLIGAYGENRLLGYVWPTCSGPADTSGNGACAQAAIQAFSPTPNPNNVNYQAAAANLGWTGEFCEVTPPPYTTSGLPICTAGFHIACENLPGVDTLGPWYDFNNKWDDGNGYCHVPYVSSIGQTGQWCRTALTNADGSNPDCKPVYIPGGPSLNQICNEAARQCETPIDMAGHGYCGRDSDCGIDFHSGNKLFCSPGANGGACVISNPPISGTATTPPVTPPTIPVNNPPILVVVNKYAGL